jgi:hypothetical protein
MYPFDQQKGSVFPDSDEIPQDSRIWYLKVVSQRYIGASTIRIDPYGLALLPTGSRSDEFRRIGTFDLGPGLDDWFAKVKRAQ